MKKLAVIVPVYNEERILEKNVLKLLSFLKRKKLGLANGRITFEIIILDSGSTDRTAEIAKHLVLTQDRIRYVNIPSPGKGGKIKQFSLSTDYDVYSFIDADLPISLEKFLAIVSEVEADRADLAIASRYAHGASSNRKLSRKVASRTYNFLLNSLCNIPTSDAFCGGKSWNRKIVEKVWPSVRNQEWFFDTELIYYTHLRKLRIKEVPVIFNDFRADSKISTLRDGGRIGLALVQFLVNKER